MSFDQILIPPQVKLIFAVGVILAAMGTGYKLSSYQSDAEIAEINAAWAEKYAVAVNARLAEEMLSRAAEKKSVEDIAAATTKFEEARQNDKAISDHTIADLRNDVKRLRVSVTRNPNRVVVPGAPATTSSCDGQGEATLAGPVAARLAERYAEYNALANTLELCQNTIRTYQATVK